MSVNTRSYYLQQLNLANWQQRSSKKVLPYECVLPARAKILFVIHLPVDGPAMSSDFLMKIAEALGVVQQEVGYALFDCSDHLKADISPLFPWLDDINTNVIVLDAYSIQNDIKLITNKANTLTLEKTFNWQSYDGKKAIMTWLLFKGLLV